MKNKSGTVVSMDLKTQVNITVEGGILLLGILRPSTYFYLEDKEIQINDMYFVLTDNSERILHISQNCVENLNFNPQILTKDVPIADFFPVLKNLDSEDELQLQNEGLVMELNFHALSLCDTNSVHPMISSKKYLSVKMFMRIHDYGNN